MAIGLSRGFSMDLRRVKEQRFDMQTDSVLLVFDLKTHAECDNGSAASGPRSPPAMGGLALAQGVGHPLVHD